MKLKFFPVGNRKKPLIENWQTLATDDPHQLETWRTSFGVKLAYWGLVTGKSSGILALDIDVKESNGWETLKKLNLQIPPTPYQPTLSGGGHFIFQYPDDGQSYGNTVSGDLGLDTRGDGGYIVIYGRGPDFSIPLAPAPTWVRKHSYRKTEEPSGPSIQVHPSIGKALLEESILKVRDAAQGEANNILNVESFKIGQIIRAGGLEEEFAKNELLKAALERGKSIKEASATIKSGFKGGQRSPLTSPFESNPPQLITPIAEAINPGVTERWTPKRLTRERLTNFKKLRKPQLYRDWSAIDIHITTADGGTGKSTLKFYESVCLALGIPFLGFQCINPGKTLFVIGEDSEDKYAAMIGQIMSQMGLFDTGNETKVEQVLESIMVKKDIDLCLIAKDRQGFLHPNTDAMKKLNEAIEDFGPDQIVFDPIASFWGSESALNDMAKAIAKFMGEIVDRHSVAVEMINHMGKSSSSAKDMSQFAGRGGTGLPSHARISRTLRTLDDIEFQELTGQSLEEGKSAILCQVNKFSDGSPLLMKPFVIIREGWLFHRLDLKNQKAQEEESNQSDSERIMDFVKKERNAGRYPTPEVVKAHFVSSGVPMKLTRISRTIDLLLYQGYGGEKLQQIDNPDLNIGGKAFIVSDMTGKEV